VKAFTTCFYIPFAVVDSLTPLKSPFQFFLFSKSQAFQLLRDMLIVQKCLSSSSFFSCA